MTVTMGKFRFVARLAATLFLPILLGASGPDYIPHVSTIGDLVALGTSAPTYPTVYVDGDFASGDGGGGYFIWNGSSTTTPDSCFVFQAMGETTGRFFRQLNGAAFTVDMCGAKTTGDPTTAFNAASTYCANNSVPLYLPAGSYRLGGQWTPPANCSWHGAGGMGGTTTNNGSTLLIATAANTSSVLIQIGDPTTGAASVQGASIGGVQISGNTGVPSGLSIDHVLREVVTDVQASTFSGVAIHFGNNIEGVVNGVKVFNSGTGGTAEVLFDGGAGEAGTLTNYTVSNMFVESSSGSTYGLEIERARRITFLGGDAENQTASGATCVGIGESSESTLFIKNIVFTGFDIESCDHAMKIGDGWSGTAGLGVSGLLYQGGQISAVKDNVTATNTTNLVIANDWDNGTAGFVDFVLTGTNIAAQIGPFSSATVGTYLTVGGTTAQSIGYTQPWYSSQNNTVNVNATTSGPVTLTPGVSSSTQVFSTSSLAGDLIVSCPTSGADGQTSWTVVAPASLGMHMMTVCGMSVGPSQAIGFTYSASAGAFKLVNPPH